MKKSFSEKVGTHGFRLTELFLQNETFGKPFLSEIPTLMPEANLTLGKLVAFRRDHDLEIKTAKTAYLVRYGKVPELGTTNLLSSLDEERVINDALRSWNAQSTFKKCSAYVAMRVNQARITAGVKKMTNADEIEERLRLRSKKK